MDYEKEYKRKALEPIVSYIESVMASYSKEELEARIKEALPKKESEDEKIRQSLIGFIKLRLAKQEEYFDTGITNKAVLAWLEKQKEQKSISFNESYNPDDYEVVMKGNATSLKQKEKKPIEGNSLFDKIMNILLWEPQRYTVLEAEKTTKAICSIFKEQTPTNSEKPKEWSEEDEKYLNLATNIVTSDFGEDSPTVSWLKSIRPHPHWKPTTEHLSALSDVLEESKGNRLAVLKDLYNHIKEV